MEKLPAALKRARINMSSITPAYRASGHQVYKLTVPGVEAVALWKRLRRLVPKTGHWPALLGTDEDLEILEESLEDAEGQSPRSVIRRGEKASVAAFFTRRQRAAVEEAREALRQFRETPDGDNAVAHYERMLAQEAPLNGLPRGAWPVGRHASSGFSIPHDPLTHKPLPAIHVGLFPAENGWEVPAFLMFGGWNECPGPQEHVAVLRSWHARYGAEVVGVTHDIVETWVARPPRTRADALALAREQYLYCPDIVDQGTETLDVLAATLLRGKSWYFWWD
jgi:hypothetical protein